MKCMRFIGLAIIVLLMAAPLAAQDDCDNVNNPDGTYTSSGSLLEGRVSEAWCSGAGPGVPGNTQNAQSWDGSTLMTQWHVWGMQIDDNGAQETGRSIDENGTGWIDYETNYTGGQFWLDANGPWGDGSMDYTGNLTYFNVSTRVTYVNGAMVGKTSNVMFTGDFDPMDCYDCSLEYVITNASWVWQSGMPDKPANYPAFLCGADQGELFDACCINAEIFCDQVPVDESSWGAVKSLYR